MSGGFVALTILGQPRFGIGIAAMIDDTSGIWALCRKLGSVGQFHGSHAEIEALA